MQPFKKVLVIFKCLSKSSKCVFHLVFWNSELLKIGKPKVRKNLPLSGNEIKESYRNSKNVVIQWMNGRFSTLYSETVCVALRRCWIQCFVVCRQFPEQLTVSHFSHVFFFISPLGIHERIDYTPASGQRVLFPDADLQLCDVPCEAQNISVRLALATRHIGKGCDRDTYSVESQRKLCGECHFRITRLPPVRIW